LINVPKNSIITGSSVVSFHSVVTYVYCLMSFLSSMQTYWIPSVHILQYVFSVETSEWTWHSLANKV